MFIRKPLGMAGGGLLAIALAACGTGGGNSSSGTDGEGVPAKCGQQVAPSATLLIANTGRRLAPLGRMTRVGNFPTGGRISPNGLFYWSVSAGHGRNDVQVVRLADGQVIQVLPLPGSYGQMAFSADGKRAYVSGTPKGSIPASGPTQGDDGDVVHVFDVDPASGMATELAPLPVPSTKDASGNGTGSARANGFPPDPGLPEEPVGIAVTPDGKTLVVAHYNADVASLIDTATGAGSTVSTGAYPYAVGLDRTGKFAYVTNAYDGTLTKIDIAAKSATTISGLGGPDGDKNSHPQYVLADPARDQLYVAVTNHDGVAVVNTKTDTVTKFISLKRAEGYGSQPVALALAQDTLYVANAGENAVVAIALSDRPGGAKAFDVIGKIPTADYTTDVQLTPDGCTMVWQAGRGNVGANPLYTSSHGFPAVNNDPGISPYPSYTFDMQVGSVGVLPVPTDAAFAQLTAVVDAAQQPANAQLPPVGTPVVSATGGPSDKIKFVFYLVKENRTYDQMFGSDPRGNGDPALEVIEDNCGAPNTAFVRDRAHFGCGTTPNQHALSRMFVLLDNFYENSEGSMDGHEITTGAYATNYSLKSEHQDYGGRHRPANDVGVFPVSFPPKYFLFDQAATQGISFRNYGELSGGAAPGESDDGRATYSQVQANSDTTNYPSNILNGCFSNQNAPNSPLCAWDCGMGCNTVPPPQPTVSVSRIDAFNNTFTSQVSGCTAATIGTPACGVPQFNYLIMMSDHTNGVSDGARDPLALIADNDLGVGQLVDILSHSAIWPYTAVFVIEDDSQDGADHVDAHRAPALVAGPYVKHGGGLVHTRYDQLSVIRTIELILGMQPLSVFDAVATPMYDAFTATPDNTPYTAIQPEFDLFAVCNQASHPCVTGSGASAKALAAHNAALSAALPYNQVDRVPQSINDQILWQRVHGAAVPPPLPGPNASPGEHARAVAALRMFEKYHLLPPLAQARLRELLDEPDGD